MICNVYDFDNTIFKGDSTLKFYFFCICHRWRILRLLPSVLFEAARYKLGISSKLDFKQSFYSFIPEIFDINQTIDLFWKHYAPCIQPWYLAQKKQTDIIISASPSFLLEPIAKKLEVRLIASKIDKETGLCLGENCWGKEKVTRFRNEYPEWEISEFYSDSYSDQPLADISQVAYLIRGNRKSYWKNKSKQ